MDGARLVDQLEKMDYEIIEDLRPEDEGETSLWARIRFNHPDTWRILYKSPEEIAGYFSFVPLFDEDFASLMGGNIIEGQITEEMVPEMELSGHFKMFFTMLGLREPYRGTSSIHLLYYSFLSLVESLSEQGIFFDEIGTNAYTPAGVAICKSFGMNFVRDSSSKGKLFRMKFYPFPRSTAFLEHPKLFSFYNAEYENNNKL